MAFWAAAAYIGGTALQLQGQRMADEAQMDALRANASFYREQEAFIKRAGLREVDIFKRKGENLVSSQIGAYARSAIGFSGSAALVVGQTEAQIQSEIGAIKIDTEHRARLAALRAQGADAQADAIKDSQSTRMFGTLLQGGGQAAAAYGSGGGFGGGK